MASTISKDKTRVVLTIEKDFKEKLTEEAKRQNRSFNNLVITILKNHMDNKKD